MKCDPTSAGRTLFSKGASFRLELADKSSQEIEISGVREHKNRLLIRFPGVDSANGAQRFAGATFFADRSRIVLEPGEYLDRDLEGCKLYDQSGALLGSVSRIEHYPTSDMLVVGGRLVPMIREFIKAIEPAAKRIVVELPPGLLDDAEAEQG